jgi:hypothetical protein
VNILVRRSTAGRADVRSRARGVARRGRHRVSGRLVGVRYIGASLFAHTGIFGHSEPDGVALHPRSRCSNASRTRTTEK